MEEELEEKTRIIEELQEDLIKSATLGKGLLDRNNELEQELKEQEDLHTEKLDVRVRIERPRFTRLCSHIH